MCSLPSSIFFLSSSGAPWRDQDRTAQYLSRDQIEVCFGLCCAAPQPEVDSIGVSQVSPRARTAFLEGSGVCDSQNMQYGPGTNFVPTSYPILDPAWIQPGSMLDPGWIRLGSGLDPGPNGSRWINLGSQAANLEQTLLRNPMG